MAQFKLKQWISSHLVSKDNLVYLLKFPLLKDFTRHELFLFFQNIQERNFKEGEIIYQEQFPLAVIYLIASGIIEIKENQANQEKSLILHKHQFFGIIDMFTENKRKGEAKALKDSVLLAVSHPDFQSFIKDNPRTGIKLLKNICQSLSHTITNELSYSSE
jgi:CRP-like cAMP-binding protein